MRRRPLPIAALLALLCAVPEAGARAGEEPIPQEWEYAPAMREVARRGTGRTGVVLHVGDSITYANPYGQWARAGAGKTPEDEAALAWMHAGADDDTDGWWLARVDLPDAGRSYTACGGIRADEMLAGGKGGMPSLAGLLDKYRPQMVVLMLGTNDASAGREVAHYQADMEEASDLILGRGVVLLLSTIPPHPGRPELVRQYNQGLRTLARSRGVPLIDYEREILRLRPGDWSGTLLGKDDIHPTAGMGGASPISAPTAENLRNSGYLLRGWLTVRKIAEVKRTVLDGLTPPGPTGGARPAAGAGRCRS